MSLGLKILLYLLLAPLAGGLLSGVDRKLTARLQGRRGPPLVQPFYDFLKLLQKETLVVRRSQNYYVIFFFVFVVFAGGLFFCGGDMLLMIFALTLGGIFLVLAGYKASSPYSFIGAQRELLQMMSYEPALLLAAIGMYMVTRSFNVAEIASSDKLLVLYLPGIFAGLVYVLDIKFRKSPFDLSTSHHAHQELVKGITTEFSGKTLALIEVAHWFENAFLLGIVGLFFAANMYLAVAAAAAVFLLLVFVDNTTARVKWEFVLLSSWLVALVTGLVNMMALVALGF